MSLHVAPEVETAVRQHAAREGISVDVLLSRAFPTRPAVSTLLREWQEQYGLPERPSGRADISDNDLFAQWLEEDAALSPEDADAERAVWHSIAANLRRVEI